MVYIAQQSFGFGEIDPNLRAQYESQPYQRGCRALSNALLSNTGSAQKRWGSVFHTASPGDEIAFECINGFGDRFMILGSATGYSIERNGTVLATYSFETSPEGKIKDFASTGDEIILLSNEGIFLHKFTKTDEGYSIERTLLDNINAHIISNSPPVFLTSSEHVTSDPGNASLEQLVTMRASGDFWNPTDVAKPIGTVTIPGFTTPIRFEKAWRSDEIWKISQPETPEIVDVPRFMYINSLESPMEAESSGYYRRPMALNDGWVVNPANDDLQIKGDAAGQRIDNTGRTPVRISFNGYTGLNISGVSDGDVRWAQGTSNQGTTFTLYAASSGSTRINISGTQSSCIHINMIFGIGWNGSGRSQYFRKDTPPKTLADDEATFDFIGPYKNWVNIGEALTTESPSITGMINNSSWPGINLGQKLTLGDISAQFNDTHKIGLSQGQVGRLLHYVNGVQYRETYFYVYDKGFHGDDLGAALEPRICLVQGNNLQTSATGNTSRNPGRENILMLQLASSYIPSDVATDAKISDGRSASHSGYQPDILTRIEETEDGETVQRVGLVGCPDVAGVAGSSATEIISYWPTFVADQDVTAVSQFTNTVYHTRTVGDENPIVDSQVFRVGEPEVDGGTNFASTTAGGIGPAAYWKLTGAALNPMAPGDLESSTLMIPERIVSHQGRTFIGGFNADQEGSTLRYLSLTQRLGLTVIGSMSGFPTNFTPGDASDNDGLSFQIASKKGGMIRWMKSQFNVLFLGSEEEEFVIPDAPMTPASINIGIQSEYGGRVGAYAVSFGSAILYVQADGKTIRAMGFEERRNRYESRDLLQFARHITQNDTIKRIDVVGTATQRLFALTNGGKLYCFTLNADNGVFGWNEWSNSEYTTIDDIVGTTDDSGNPALWARTSKPDSIFITSDDTRDNYHVDGAIDYATGITTSQVTVSSAFNGKTVSAIITDSSENIVYVGDGVVSATVFPLNAGVFTFGTALDGVPSKVVVGYPYTMTLAPNIPELMVPGKGSTLGREKNVSRLRILFNMVRGAVAGGYELNQVPASIIYDPVADEPGFYSVPVIGEYGPQPTINITQSAPYGFEISGYNAEYDFGD